MPPRNRFNRDDILISPLGSRPVRVQPVEDELRKRVEADVRETLGIQGALPQDVQEIVATASATAAAKSVELAVSRATEQVAADIGRKNVLTRFDDKIKVAADSMVHIGQSNEVDEVLRQRATLLAKKRDALVTAGFSNDEAMQILLADIAAKAH
jgi:hypothetical protein